MIKLSSYSHFQLIASEFMETVVNTPVGEVGMPRLAVGGNPAGDKGNPTVGDILAVGDILVVGGTLAG